MYDYISITCNREVTREIYLNFVNIMFTNKSQTHSAVTKSKTNIVNSFQNYLEYDSSVF